MPDPAVSARVRAQHRKIVRLTGATLDSLLEFNTVYDIQYYLMDHKARDFGWAVSDGYRRREAELRSAIGEPDNAV